MTRKSSKKSASKKSAKKAKAASAPPSNMLSSREALAQRTRTLNQKEDVLAGARVYLSGPMDFVASREDEKKNGWRNRVSQFLRRYKTVVYDPWNKPTVIGMPEYGKEDEFTSKARDAWTFEDSEHGDRTRAKLCDQYWSTLHIDLRMVDTTDFTIAYCPTNVYSVGTVHEIVMARLQYKPVLFVSPPIAFPALNALKDHFDKNKDAEGAGLLDQLVAQSSIHSNENAIPSLWYMALLGGHYFFDGFGFASYMKDFKSWQYGALDEREERFPPKRPLLPYLEKLNQKVPTRYDLEQNKYVDNPDWLILNPNDVQ